MKEQTYLVIMAGGVGSRFWPYSRQKHPKQFMDILGTGKTLLQLTVDRFRSLVPIENIYVVTNQEYGKLVHHQIPDLHTSQVLLEALRRNTAPCIAYASYKIRKKDPDARIIVTPSDHVIFNERSFVKSIKLGLKGAEKDEKLITVGIKPSRPETGYGYIQYMASKSPLKKVKTFTEKPEIDLARKFVESGDFVWNAGIFIWHVDAITQAFSSFLPDVAELFEEVISSFDTRKEKAAVDEVYSQCKAISIDYAVMEKSDRVFVVLGDFGWSDLGSWNSLYEISKKDGDGNVIAGNVISYDTTDCIFKIPGDRLLVVEGLDGFLVADHGNATVICRKENEKRFRDFIKDVRSRKGEDYL